MHNTGRGRRVQNVLSLLKAPPCAALRPVQPQALARACGLQVVPARCAPAIPPAASVLGLTKCEVPVTPYLYHSLSEVLRLSITEHQ